MLLLLGPLERLHVLVSRESHGVCLVGALDSARGVQDMTKDGNGASAGGDLDHVVGVVRDGHELREGGVAEDGVVGEIEPLVTPVKGLEGMSHS